MTEDFVPETILILFLIFAIGIAVGHYWGRLRFEARLLSDAQDETATCLSGGFYYLLPAYRFNELRICEMRCERRDRQLSDISVLTGTHH